METYREILSKLNNNRVYLVNNLDVENGLIDFLIQKKILTNNMAESLLSMPTRSQKISELLSILPRRGSDTLPFFKEALLTSHQVHIHNVLFPKDIIKTESNVFASLSKTIEKLDNAVENHTRHGDIYLTTTATYNERAPVSKIGGGVLPYLFAHKAIGYSKATIVNMEGCCTPEDFDKFLNLYDSEIDEVKKIIKNLKHGGLHFNIEIRNDKMKKMFQKRNIKMELDRLDIILDSIDIDKISPDILTFYACQIHLICFGKYWFVIRKSQETRPNCYLLYQGRIDSPIVRFKDVSHVQEAIYLDETPKEITKHLSVEIPW